MCKSGTYAFRIGVLKAHTPDPTPEFDSALVRALSVSSVWLTPGPPADADAGSLWNTFGETLIQAALAGVPHPHFRLLPFSPCFGTLPFANLTYFKSSENPLPKRKSKPGP